jgi:hypothetical protein
MQSGGRGVGITPVIPLGCLCRSGVMARSERSCGTWRRFSAGRSVTYRSRRSLSKFRRATSAVCQQGVTQDPNVLFCLPNRATASWRGVHEQLSCTECSRAGRLHPGGSRRRGGFGTDVDILHVVRPVHGTRGDSGRSPLRVCHPVRLQCRMAGRQTDTGGRSPCVCASVRNCAHR